MSRRNGTPVCYTCFHLLATRDICLSEAELAKLAEGLLSGERRAAAARHVAACSQCGTVYTALAGSPSARLAVDETVGDGQAQTGWVPPTMFDEYRLVKVIGHGAAGQVWLARDVQLDRLVAIKFLSGAAREGARERFRMEARAIARLAHPNVVSVHRVGEIDGCPYLVSEYVGGKSLDRLPKPLPWTEVREIGRGLARGMAAAHRAGVLHRDIKPANAMLSSSGEVKLLDFGLAKLLEPGGLDASIEASLDSAARRRAQPDESPVALTTTGAIVGTPLYMAPEVWTGASTTARMDVYSLGALLYELCVGKPPHSVSSFDELRRAVASSGVTPLVDAVPGIDPRFAAVIMRCLERDPNARWASGDALHAALEERPPARRDWRWWAVGGVVAIGVVVLLVRGSGPPAAPVALDRNEAGDRFASALAVADVTGDGRDDLLVGVPGEGGGGAVDVFAGGRAGLEPWARLRVAESAEFGAVVLAADLDGARGAEIVIGAREATHVFRGRQRWKSLPAGHALAVGDLDGDGQRDDLVVAGAEVRLYAGPGLDGLGELRTPATRVLVAQLDGAGAEELVLAGGGEVRVYRDRQLWRTLQGDADADGTFGAALAIGDVDGDGRSDVVVGAPGAGAGGRVYVFGGAELALLRTYKQVGLDEEGDAYGSSLVAVDFDVSPGAELLVAAPAERPYGADAPMAGQVYVVRSEAVKVSSWNDLVGSTMAPPGDGDAFGTALAAGDVDGDGLLDVFVGAPGFEAGDAEDSGGVFWYEQQKRAFAPRRVVDQETVARE